ncbi:MAG: hypothetical protein LBC27_06220 [Spirochaetaceae bacterium]|jgi:hypothetical protein|nr:hypothetical protein [Spirochaetaceae bacterium]
MIFNLFRKELTLAEKQSVDGEQIEAQSIRRRIRNAIYGSLIGDIAGTSVTAIDLPKSPVLTELPPVSYNMFRYIQNIIAGKDNFYLIKMPQDIPLTACILPFIFVHDLSFNEILRLVCRFSTKIRNDIFEQTGYALYLSILLRLYHYDDFENAADITLETAERDLQNTEYAMVLHQYECLYSKRIKTLPKSDIQKMSSITDYLQASLWCCMNGSNFHDIILSGKIIGNSIGNRTSAVPVLSGAMAGLYYRYDVSEFLPKTPFDYNAVIKTFENYCLKTRS